jgi:hypothetical protein
VGGDLDGVMEAGRTFLAGNEDYEGFFFFFFSCIGDLGQGRLFY